MHDTQMTQSEQPRPEAKPRQERLMADPGIIRNRLKIAAVIDNARRVQELRREHGSFAGWLDAHHPLNRDEWVKLFKRTFRFTGGEIVNEFLMSLGYLAGAHEPNCPIYARIAVLDPPWATENAAGRAMRVADDRAAPN